MTDIKTDQILELKLASYPDEVKGKMLFLRKLIHETAVEIGLNKLEETTKWGEPSFISPQGSTLRMDWKTKSPDQYALYFKCTTRLVETFKLIFGSSFKYEGKRAIVFSMDHPSIRNQKVYQSYLDIS